MLDVALSHVPDPKSGLPQELFYFVSRMTPMVNVDLLIKNRAGQTLLTWREDEFYGPAWHIPGGIIRFKERIEDRIVKVANLEVGCGVRFSADPINVRGMINASRDIRGHFISLVYLCELDGDPTPSNEANHDAPLAGQWSWHNFAPKNLLSVHEPFRKFINDTPPL